MNKLNNKGWGLAVMLAFIGVFFLAILIIAILSSKYGLLTNDKNEINSENSLITTNRKYIEYEQTIELSAVDYIQKHDNNIKNNDIIDINNLEIESEVKQECEGYIKVSKVKNDTSSKAYINCSNYQTEGYTDAFNR